MPKNNQEMAIEDLAIITKKGFDEVDKRFDEVDKRFDEVDKRFDEVDKRFEGVNKRFDKIEATINLLPDKAHLGDRLADLEGSVIVRQRKEDKKVNLLVEFLQKKKILEEGDVKMLKEIQVFPGIESSE